MSWLLHSHDYEPPIFAAEAAVTGDERQDVIRGFDLNPRVIQGQGFGAAHKAEELRVAVEIRCGRLPVAVSHIENGKHLISGDVVECVEIDRRVICVEALLLVIGQRAEHDLHVASDVMPVDSDVSAWRLEVCFEQRKQRADTALFACERMAEIVVRIIRPYDGVIDGRVRDLKPADEVGIGGFAG